jgi:REP element-mobilizing transposase RayT
MSVRKAIPEYDGIFFITFTCWKWLPLFQLSDGYNAVYKWFDFLKGQGHFITAYVIMPNHIHALIAFRNTQGVSINSIVGNGKRFIAYEIIKKLKELNKPEVLNELEKAVKKKDKIKGKLHEVFEPSFEWKDC